MAAFGLQLFFPVLVPRVGCLSALVWDLQTIDILFLQTLTQTHTQSNNLAMSQLTTPFRPGYDSKVKVLEKGFHHLKFVLNNKNKVGKSNSSRLTCCSEKTICVTCNVSEMTNVYAYSRSVQFGLTANINGPTLIWAVTTNNMNFLPLCSTVANDARQSPTQFAKIP